MKLNLYLGSLWWEALRAVEAPCRHRHHHQLGGSPAQCYHHHHRHQWQLLVDHNNRLTHHQAINFSQGGK